MGCCGKSLHRGRQQKERPCDYRQFSIHLFHIDKIKKLLLQKFLERNISHNHLTIGIGMNAIGEKFRFILKKGEKVYGFTFIIPRNLLYKRNNLIFHRFLVNLVGRLPRGKRDCTINLNTGHVFPKFGDNAGIILLKLGQKFPVLRFGVISA